VSFLAERRNDSDYGIRRRTWRSPYDDSDPKPNLLRPAAQARQVEPPGGDSGRVFIGHPSRKTWVNRYNRQSFSTVRDGKTRAKGRSLSGTAGETPAGEEVAAGVAGTNLTVIRRGAK
jgi:hypothetical protein